MKKFFLLFVLAGAATSLLSSCASSTDEEIPIYGIDSSRIAAVTSIDSKPAADSCDLHFKYAGSTEQHMQQVPKRTADSLTVGGPIKITKRKQVIVLRNNR